MLNRSSHYHLTSERVKGGPGGSGIDTLISYRSDAGKIFGEQYNFVSFDPRGVNNSGLALDCFSGNVEAKAAFTRIHRSGSTNTSSTVLETQYYATSIIGEWCNHAVQEKSPYSYYVTTPAVTRDIITYIEAEAESSGKPRADAKLWYYGLSYGTVIGTTFAVMFPERIGRLILDGVVDAEEYYTNNWRSNIAQDDEMVASFASFCHEAGSGNCSFWGPSPENITCRLDNIISQLEHEPVPLSGVDTNSIPTLATSSDLKALILSAGYEPLISFPQLADVLSEFERGNATGLGGVVQRFGGFSDASNMIKCADTYTRNKVVTIGEWKEYVEYTTAESRYVGDIYPIGGDTIACRGFRPNLPDSMIYQGRFPLFVVLIVQKSRLSLSLSLGFLINYKTRPPPSI